MSSIINAISSAMRNAFAGGTRPHGGYDEAYLAESQDIYELERRMRALDNSRCGRGDLHTSAFLSMSPAGTGR